MFPCVPRPRKRGTLHGCASPGCRLILPIPCPPDRGPFPPSASAATFARGFRLIPVLTLSSPTRDPFSKLHCRHEAGSDSSGYRDLPENFVEQRCCPLAA